MYICMLYIFVEHDLWGYLPFAVNRLGLFFCRLIGELLDSLSAASRGRQLSRVC